MFTYSSHLPPFLPSSLPPHDSLHAFHLHIITSQVFKTAADTFIWQLFASVLIPGYTINLVAKQSTRLMTLDAIQRSLNPLVRRYAPTAIGLAVIPLIIHPIDTGVDFVMDRTFRKVF